MNSFQFYGFRCWLDESSQSEFDSYTVRTELSASGGYPIGEDGVNLPWIIMAKLLAENSVSRNGSNGRQPVIGNADVSRTVGELEGRPNGKHADTKVRVQFKMAASEAKKVSVAGTFNGWDPQKTPLKKHGDAWGTTIALSRGSYEYRFVVDGE